MGNVKRGASQYFEPIGVRFDSLTTGVADRFDSCIVHLDERVAKRLSSFLVCKTRAYQDTRTVPVAVGCSECI
jgi:hypothetical protein